MIITGILLVLSIIAVLVFGKDWKSEDRIFAPIFITVMGGLLVFSVGTFVAKHVDRKETTWQLVSIEGERLPLVYRIQDDQPKYFFFGRDDNGIIHPTSIRCEKAEIIQDGQNKVVTREYIKDVEWSWWTWARGVESDEAPERPTALHISHDSIRQVWPTVYTEQIW